MIVIIACGGGVISLAFIWVSLFIYWFCYALVCIHWSLCIGGCRVIYNMMYGYVRVL